MYRMLLAVGAAGALGTLARYGLGAFVQRFAFTFPYGTLAVNVLGSFMLGALMRAFLLTTASPELRTAMTVGLCGGFTTFSTFSYETATLLEAGSYGRAAAYVAASVGLSLLATFAGFVVARLWFAPAS